MAAVVIERRFEKPVSLDFLAHADRSARWCLDAHGCRLLMQSLTTDGLSSLCVYEAPDAEALRRVSKQVGVSPPPAIWAAAVHYDPSDPRPGATELKPGENGFAVVDRAFDAPMEYAEVRARRAEKSSCLTMHGVRFLRSYLSLDGRRLACVYAAPDVEAVRSAVRMTGLAYDFVRQARAAE